MKLKDWYRKYWFVALSGAISLLFLYLFHNIFWWPKDDSVFAYLADQIYSGGVYGVDVFDIHGGYHHFLNALMYKWFGVEMVVLRYPLIFIGTIQAMLVAYMLRKQGAVIAATLGFATVGLGFLLFPNPSPNWYALFFAIVVTFIFTEFKISWKSLSVIGLVLGLCFMFRHPSAVFLSMGVVAYVLHNPGGVRKSFVAELIPNIILICMTLVMVWYSHMMFEPFAFVLFAIPPLAFTSWLWFQPKLENKDLFKYLAILGVGFFSAILPMVVYQIWAGDIGTWLHESFFGGTIMSEKDFFGQYSYVGWLTGSLKSAVESTFLPSALVFASYHLIFYFTPLIVSGFAALQLNFKRVNSFPPIFYIIVFYGLVSFYYQVPFYYQVSFPLFFVAFFLMFSGSGSQIFKFVLKAFVVLFTLLGFVMGAPGVFYYSGTESFTYSELPRVGLYLMTDSNDSYVELMDAVNEYSNPEDTLFAFPFDPEFHFISGRPNIFPFIGTSFNVTSEAEYKNLLDKLTLIQPRLIVYNKKHSYNNMYDKLLFEKLENGYLDYVLVEEIDGYHFYVIAEIE